MFYHIADAKTPLNHGKITIMFSLKRLTALINNRALKSEQYSALRVQWMVTRL